MSYAIGKLTRTRSDGSKYWSYCVIWHEGSSRVRRSLDTQDRIAAETRAKKLWAERDLPDAGTVGAVVAAYLAQLPEGKDRRRKDEAWLAAKGYWGALLPSDVDEATSAAYVAWRARAVNTCRLELSLVRTALRWALKAEAPKVVVPAIPASSVNHLSKAQFKRFLEGCRAPHVRLFAILGVTTGGRATALLQTKWDQVDFDRCQLRLHRNGEVATSKGRATVALNDRAMEALREAKAGAVSEYVIEYHGGPVLSIKKGIEAAAARSKVKCHPHMFRHSAAVWMAEDRVPMSEIAAFLGHRDSAVTSKVYARYSPDFLREAARSLTW